MIFEEDNKDNLININELDEIDACNIDINILKKRNQYQNAKSNNLFRFKEGYLRGIMGIKYIIAADFNNSNTQKSKYFFLGAKDKNNSLYIDPESPKFFVKYDKKTTAADDALNSAFISCFAKTMQPIISDNEFTKITTGMRDYESSPADANYIVWEYIEEQDTESNKNINDFILGCSYCNNMVENKEDDFLRRINGIFLQMDKDKDRKTAIEFAVQYIFFNMFDRLRSGNIIAHDADLIHIDTQRHEDEKKNDGFFFSLSESANEQKRKSFNVFFRFLCNNDKRVELAKEALKKCSNINYDTFLYNYIRNCIYLKVKPKDALKNLHIFLKRMVSFYNKQPLTKIKHEIENSIKEKIDKIEASKDMLSDDLSCIAINNYKKQLERLSDLEKLFNNATKDILNNFNNSAIKKNVLDANKNNSLIWLKNKYKTVQNKILKLNKENNFIDKEIENFDLNDEIEEDNSLFNSFKRKCVQTCVDTFNKICCCTK